MFQRPVIKDIATRMKQERSFIQVIAGPRQIGKTTLVLQLLDMMKVESRYITADGAGGYGESWLEKHWEAARQIIKSKETTDFILAIDEIQKIENWSETVKKLWDEDTVNQIRLKVIISGSSRLLLQKGLTESLAGRFEITYMGHWSLTEMEAAFGWSANQFVWYGGYPGSALLIEDERRWKRYITDSLVETSISKDILMLTRVDKPALMHRLFELGCRYSGQELSFTKMLGQLQDSGNTVTLAHYLKLLGSAGLLSGIEKYSGSIVRQRSSSPKFIVHNTALMSSAATELFGEITTLPDRWGRFVESAIGAHLLDGYVKGYYSLYYWRKGYDEVDYVVVKGEKVLALEVKTGTVSGRSGIEAFNLLYRPYRVILIGERGIHWQEFLKMDMSEILQ